MSLRQEAGDIEAGAGLVGVLVVMANNAGLGKETVETLEQRRERLALGRCTRVLERDITALRRCRAMDDEMSDGGYVIHGGLMMMDDGANGDFQAGVLHRFTP